MHGTTNIKYTDIYRQQQTLQDEEFIILEETQLSWRRQT